jgi:TolB protein
MSRVLPVLLLGLSTLLLACGTADPMLSQTPEGNVGAEPGGKILFVAERHVQLWDDGTIRQLTKDEYDARSPTWAHVGDRFAFISMADGYSDLIVADANGNPLVQVTSNAPADEPFSQEYAFNAAWALDPVWSPVGDQIIFVSDMTGLDPYSDPLLLWYSETWESPPYLLEASANLNRMQENPTLSPSGEQVAFVVRTEATDTRRNTEIWTLDLDTAERQVLVAHPDGAYDPAWSPDGNTVAYIQRDGSANEVWIAPVNGQPAYQLTTIGTCVSPVWSPDGKFLAFFRERDGGFEAWYVELTGDSTQQLTASEPRKLFDADGIDTTSGMSWIDP